MRIKKSSLNKAIVATVVFALVSAIIETLEDGVVLAEFATALVIFFVLFYAMFELIRKKREKAQFIEIKKK